MTMSVLGLVSIVCGMIPIVIVKWLKWTPSSTGDALSPMARDVLSGLLCFGGGVLMGTGFLHMLPETHEGWETYTKNHNIDVNLPLGIIVICAGFFLVYFVEEVAHLVADRHAHNQADVSLHRAVSIRSCPVSRDGISAPCDSHGQETSEGEASCQSNISSICQKDCRNKEFCRDVEVESGVGSSKSVAPGSSQLIVGIQTTAPTTKNGECYGTFKFPESEKHSHDDHDHNSADRNQCSKNFVYGSQGTIRKADNQTGDVILRVPSGKDTTSSHHHGHGGHHHHGLPIKDGHCVGASLRGLFVIIALSLHEVLEGLAVGLQNEQAGVLQLFAAVASHKFVISFCVGLELSTTGVTLLIHTIYILTFSLVTPLGIGIGIAMTAGVVEGDADHSLSSLILQGLACGTILYVAFFEILERERSKKTVGLLQWTLLLLGFLAIMGLQSQAREPSDSPAALNLTMAINTTTAKTV